MCFRADRPKPLLFKAFQWCYHSTENVEEPQNTMNTNPEPPQSSESAIRRKAFRRGYKLTKLRENSRGYEEHGPYMIARLSTNALVESGLTLQEAADWIANAKDIA